MGAFPNNFLPFSIHMEQKMIDLVKANRISLDLINKLNRYKNFFLITNKTEYCRQHGAFDCFPLFGHFFFWMQKKIYIFAFWH